MSGVSLQKRMQWIAAIWAAGAYVVLLLVPAYRYVSDTAGTDGSRTVESGSRTLAEVVGPRIYIVLAIPLLAALLTVFPWPFGFRRIADRIGATIAAVFAVLGAFTLGMFFLPTAFLLLAAAVMPATPPPSASNSKST